MITKIIVENFMAHKRTELELGPGVTALTGPNNTGKSALVEALRCVAENPTPKHFIRHGAKEARVTVVLDDGHEITWIRKKASPGYEILRPGAEEPEEFWKLGRGGVPEEVRKLLRMDKVDLGDNNPVDVHIGDQREPVFLLNRPDRAVADFLASSSEGAYLLDMQGALKRKVLDKRRELAGREARLRDIKDELDTLEPLPDISLAMEQAQALGDRLDGLLREIPALEEVLRARAELFRQLEAAKAERQALKPLSEAPAPHPLAALRETIAEQADLQRRIAFGRAYEDVLQTLADPPQTQETAALSELHGELRTVADALGVQRARAGAMDGLKPLPEIADVSGLDALYHEISDGSALLRRLRSAGKSLGSLRQPPEMEVPEGLGETLESLRTLRDMLAGAKGEQAEAERELAEHRARLAERLEAIGRCPVCGGELEVGEFMDDGGAHDH
ncbi:AAA family ATPase [Salidesulfovibrio brasiliensis]|uniref:AAA family ATPase n=1 Tax=Salidesulfovibrio brasiliensis TaxID=221711 RepID=UPI0006CFD1B5|nr:AAA family ATPase [Salidesulfovibrio brasiliensis]